MLLGTACASWAGAAPGTGRALSHQLPSPKLLCSHFCFSFCDFSPPHSPPLVTPPPIILGSLSYFHIKIDSMCASWVLATLTKFISAHPPCSFFLKRPGGAMSASHPQAPAVVPRGPQLPGVTQKTARLKQAAHASIHGAMKHLTTGHDHPAWLC